MSAVSAGQGPGEDTGGTSGAWRLTWMPSGCHQATERQGWSTGSSSRYKPYMSVSVLQVKDSDQHTVRAEEMKCQMWGGCASAVNAGIMSQRVWRPISHSISRPAT
ncbi:hypothetical protein CDAR_11541 [Caerostris darwini]|uniref:Uncharacterized protein n=1 Tax=Caerostris darwini TaxID=1538125 RepID=A0AAV4R9K1_9ARAC|nr:hypothetical protein CDAR_11541 [Caerostris darwini]